MDVELTAQLQLAMQGDVQAFSYVATAFRERVLAWARECTGNSHTAEDAAQEALLTAFRQLSDVRELAAFPAWLKTVTRTAAFRQQRRRRLDSPAEPDQAAELDDPVVAAELRQAVRGAVKGLSDPQQQVIERHYLRGEKIGEIAAALGLPTGTVKRRLHDAREKLRAKLSGFGPVSDDQWKG